MISRWYGPGAAMLLATASCAEGSADFHARYERDFTPAPTTVSVFGVFHEGRMSHEAWGQVGPKLSATLGQKACETGYGDSLSAAKPELYAAIDESVRDEGITEDLLERVATSAEGEMILVVSLNAHTTVLRGIEDGPTPNGMMPGGGNRARGVRGPSAPRGRGAALDEIGISGTLFSVRRQRSVARLSMTYTGSNLDDAIGRFVSRIGTMVPGSRCLGWRWGTGSAQAR